MSAALLLAALLWPAPQDVRFERVTLELGGALLDRRLEDVDGDGRAELLLAVLTGENGDDGDERRRELRIHRLDERGVPASEPWRVIPVHADIVAYGLADVRSEAGRELLFLTPGGAWSYSAQLSGYRGNARRLADLPLLYAIADPERLPWWGYVIEQEGGDWVLLPGVRSFTLWAPRAAAPGSNGDEPASDYEQRVDFALGGTRSAEFVTSTAANISYDKGDVHFSISLDEDHLFLSEEPRALDSLLATDDDYRAPALADVDGDGRIDLLYKTEDGVAIHLTRGGSIPHEPTRVEPIPEALEKKGREVKLQLQDIDGDGDVDVLARSEQKDQGLEAGVVQFMVLFNDGQRLLPERPNQVLRFRGHELTVDITDISGDGRPDFVVTKYEIPSMMEMVTGFELRRSSFVFLGEDELPFGRRPVLRDEQVFDIDTLIDAIVLRHVSHDMSGDGVADLVEVDLGGRVCIRRIQQDTGFFGGGDWELQSAPWKRFDVRGSILSLEIDDVNGDGVGDLLTAAGQTLTLLLSERTP